MTIIHLTWQELKFENAGVCGELWKAKWNGINVAVKRYSWNPKLFRSVIPLITYVLSNIY